MKSIYHPIACGFHDRLLEKATLRELCNIQYKETNGQEKQLEARIKDVFTTEEGEFMLLSSGERIRLDQIVALNGLAFPKPSDENSCKL